MKDAPEARGAREPAAGPRLQSFHELGLRHVQRILLVSSLYESFIMSEEGRLHETLLSQFVELNLPNVPDLVQVPRPAEALELVREGGFDLVIASLVAGELSAGALAAELRRQASDVPVIGLAYTNRDLADLADDPDRGRLERVFLWQGDTRILMAMVSYLEDRWNVERDSGERGVPIVLVVEDNVRFYSSFLPVVHAELLRHTQKLLSEDLNLSQRMLRMRARPKVLLCGTFEEAAGFLERYPDQVIGIVSDVEYPRGGALDARAGLDLCAHALELRPDIRLVLQSSRPENRVQAEEIGASFLLKGSATLLHELRGILVERFGFGDFVFRSDDGVEVARAADLEGLERQLERVPAEVVARHAARNQFSNWLKARTELALAERLRPRTVEEFESPDHLRRFLLEEIGEHRRERLRTVVSEFRHGRFEPSATITRIGGGSLGGKARGVAFANRLLLDSGLQRSYPGVELRVPPSVVVGTEVFDEFLEHEDLRDFAIASTDDGAVEEMFLRAPFPRRAVADLRALVQHVRHPLAVRSSSLLEDSLSQPFAGVYRTVMLPNSDPELDVRWRQLVAAVKLVYASAFTQGAKAYLAMTSYRLEEEKMAVMIQALAGNRHRDRFYPDFAGVARSLDFYPEPGHAPEDGVAALALGLGRTVVDGSPCLRFSPRHPREIVSFASVDATLRATQRELWAVDLVRDERDLVEQGMRRFGLETAEEDGVLAWMGSTYLVEDHRIVDGISRPGVRLVTFAQVLKHGAFPLPELLCDLLRLCAEGTGGPVEIEFAGNLAGGERRRAELAFLQLRPLALSKEQEEVRIPDVPEERVVCRASRVLGNGRVELADLVVVDAAAFDRQRSREVALQVARMDAVLRREGRPYLLVGPGRWGSADPKLGIPVVWSQIAGARAIVEAGFEDLHVEPSQGTHFFQNLTSCGVGYFTVDPAEGGKLDWEWLAALPAAESAGPVRRVQLERPLLVVMSGRTSEGVVLAPDGRG